MQFVNLVPMINHINELQSVQIRIQILFVLNEHYHKFSVV